MLVVAFGGLILIERYTIREALADDTLNHGRMLDGYLTMAGQPLRLFVESNARRTSFTRPDEEKRGASAESTLGTGLRTYEISEAWVLEADGALRLQVTAEGRPPQPPPVSPSQLAQLKSPRGRLHFHLARLGALYEVRGLRLAASGTNPDAPRGWLFAARRLDGASLATSTVPLHGRLSLVPALHAGQPPSSAQTMRIERIMHDLDGRPTMAIRLDFEPFEQAALSTMNRLGLVFLGVLGLGAVGLGGAYYWRSVMAPAAVLQQGLAQQDPVSLQPLISAGGSFATLAALARDSITARHQLELKLAERARLSRDLHDSTIQTLYAAGMHVAGARALLKSSLAAADDRLERALAALNATAVDVRNFILGFEPETLRNHTFRQNVEFVLTLLRPIRPVDFRTEIDNDLCARFTAEQKIHALQVVREALTHNLREATSTFFTVRVQAQPDGGVLEIEDDGTGFDPANTADGGLGFKGLAVRATELGGALAIARVEPQGTRIRLSITLASAGNRHPDGGPQRIAG